MKHSILSLSLLSCILLGSCESNQNEILTQEEGKTQILFSVDPFLTSGEVTRTNCNPSNNYSVTWASGDVIGIFPREGYQEPFEIPTDQVGLSKASFDGGYWALKNGLSYNAYYPFDKVNFESADCKTTIPVTYLGQSQTGSACNVGAFDYLYSDWTESTNKSVNFKFHHIGSFLVLTLKIPATTTYTSLTISADSEVIPTAGTYDLTASKPAFVASTMASSLTMSINYAGTANEDATFYMMMPPCDLSNCSLKAILVSGNKKSIYKMESLTINASHLYEITGIPSSTEISDSMNGWEQDPLCFTAQENGSTISIMQTGNPSNGKIIQYSTDGTSWTNTYVGQTISLTNTGDKVYFKSTDELPLGESAATYRYFAMTGKIAASGNIQSLMNYSKQLKSYNYQWLFKKCKALTSAPDLPATLLADYCYYCMFYECSSLKDVPNILPATKLKDYSYSSMFHGCTSLTKAPEIAATQLGICSCSSMFSFCSSLTSAPTTLPAMTLAQSCYGGMFCGCTILEQAPELPATTLAGYCYNSMFSLCTSLKEAPNLPAATLSPYCYDGMFSNCTSLTSAPSVLPATQLVESCYFNMFYKCSSLTIAPVINARILEGEDCCAHMFQSCTNLNYVKAMFTSSLTYIDEDNCRRSYTYQWLSGVSSTGTFVKNSSATWNVSGENGIPTGWTIQTASE